MIKTENVIQDGQHGFTEGKSCERILPLFFGATVVRKKITDFYYVILLPQHGILRQLIFTVLLLLHSTSTRMLALYVELTEHTSHKQKARSVTDLGK